MAPEHPYPTPINECYTLTKYVLESSHEFGDTDRVVLAGDSAGGNIVAVMTQKLLADGLKIPKLQVLVYPWTQMLNNRLPSYMRYRHAMPDISVGKIIGWYLGIDKLTHEIEQLLVSNNHAHLISDLEHKQKLLSYTDFNMIPHKYRHGRLYYNHSGHAEAVAAPEHASHLQVIREDKHLTAKIDLLFTPDMSPGLSDIEKLRGLPPAYFILCEMDPIKDDGLIYSERLRQAGVPVQVNLYDGFHGIVSQIDDTIGFQLARDMLNDLVNFISINV